MIEEKQQAYSKEAIKTVIREANDKYFNSYVVGQEKIQQLENNKRNAELAIKEKDEIIKMRRSWSDWLLRAICSIVIFDMVIITLIGFRLMKFEGHIVPIFISESLLKILALAIIVVQFLFNTNKKNLENDRKKV